MADEALKYLIAWCDANAAGTLRFAENMRGDPENAFQDSANFDACSKALSELARLRAEREDGYVSVPVSLVSLAYDLLRECDKHVPITGNDFDEEMHLAICQLKQFIRQPLPAPPVQSHEEKRG